MSPTLSASESQTEQLEDRINFAEREQSALLPYFLCAQMFQFSDLKRDKL